MISWFIGWFNDMLIEENGRTILFRGSKQNQGGGASMAYIESAMGTCRSTILQHVAICYAVLVLLNHALTHGAGTLFIVFSEISRSVLLGTSLWCIVMLPLTILSHSDNLTNLLIEGLISCSRGFEMCECLFFLQNKCTVKGGPCIDADAL